MTYEMRGERGRGLEGMVWMMTYWIGLGFTMEPLS